jgi:hypothetical protein
MKILFLVPEMKTLRWKIWLRSWDEAETAIQIEKPIKEILTAELKSRAIETEDPSKKKTSTEIQKRLINDLTTGLADLEIVLIGGRNGLTGLKMVPIDSKDVLKDQENVQISLTINRTDQEINRKDLEINWKDSEINQTDQEINRKDFEINQIDLEISQKG